MKTSLSSVVGLSVVLWLSGAAGVARVSADTKIRRSPVAKTVRKMNPANWSMPDWKTPNFRSIVPGQKKSITKKAIPKNNKNGVLDGVSKSARNGLNSTKKALNPKNLDPRPLFGLASTKSKPKTPPKSSKPEKPGFWGSLFAPEPEDSGPKTMPDWIGGDRPGM